MCGRFGISATADQLALLLKIDPSDVPEMQARYNIAPTTLAPIVRHNAQTERKVHLVRWGLVPSWAKELGIGSRLINARSETVVEKPAFRDAFQRRRCLVMTDGFYEWHTPEGSTTKQAYHIGLADESPFAMAGLWERWQPDEAQAPLDTFTILTTQANPVLSPIHHRMPVILAPTDYDTWLRREGPVRAARDLLRPCPPDAMVRWPVSDLVNSPKNDDPRLRRAMATPSDAPAEPR
jgi:putative SOS response-associated peptidase YedK